MRKELSNNFHIVYLRSSNALDFTIGEKLINYKIVPLFSYKKKKIFNKNIN